MTWTERISRAALKSSLLWGAAAAVGCYFAFQKYGEMLLPPYLFRCLNGRWESYVCVAMFLVGFAAVVIKAVELVQEWTLFFQYQLPAVPGEQNLAAVRAMLKQLGEANLFVRATYLHRRMTAALEHVLRKGNDGLEEHLRYLADLDSARMNNSYGTLRFMSWAIPAVGSFGTVLGIAAAITTLSLQGADESLSSVTAGLAVAFDITALALALSISLMVLKFICEQQEMQLLLAVEERAERELAQSVGNLVSPRGSQADQLRKLTESIVEATEKLAQRQTGMWQNTLEQTGEHWEQQTAAVGEQLEAIVSRAVAKAVVAQPGGVASAPAAMGGQLTDMSQVEDALQKIATFFSRQQAEQMQESEVITQLAEIIRESQSSFSSRKPQEAAGGGIAGLWSTLAD